jgi:hypothetical protein
MRRKVVTPTTVCPERLSSASRRGRLVDYGAALEMRFGATRRGFESRPLRHRPSVGSPGTRDVVDAVAPAILPRPC